MAAGLNLELHLIEPVSPSSLALTRLSPPSPLVPHLTLAKLPAPLLEKLTLPVRWVAPAAETVAWQPVLSPSLTVEGAHANETFGSIPGTVVEIIVAVEVTVAVTVDVTVVVVGDVVV